MVAAAAQLHQKVKGASADIVSIDAVHLETQQIVITVVVNFAAAHAQLVQTIVLEPKLEDGETLWLIANDLQRFHNLTSPRPRPERAPKPAKAAEKAAEKAPEEKEVQESAAPLVVEPVAPVVAAAEPVPIAVQTHVTKPRQDRGKKAAAAQPQQQAAQAAPQQQPAVEKHEKPAAPAKPLSWAERAASGSPKPADAGAAPVVTEKAAPKTVHPITVTATTPSGATSSDAAPAAAAYSDLRIFVKASAPIKAESVQAAFAKYGNVKVDVKANGTSALVIIAGVADQEALFTQIQAAQHTADGAALEIEKARAPAGPRGSGKPRTHESQNSRGENRGPRSSGGRRNDKPQ